MRYVLPLLVACLTLSLQGCVAKNKPFDGMTIVSMRTDANGNIVSANVTQSSGDPKADIDAVRRAKVEVNDTRRKLPNTQIHVPVKQRGVEARR